MRVRIVLVAVAFLSCVGARPKFRSTDQWTEVVLARLCESYGEEFRESTAVAVVDTTQPVFDFAALLYVNHIDVTPETARRAQDLEAQARGQFIAVPILVPESACGFQAVPKQSRYRDVVQLEMSSLVVDPFEGSTGVFVRSSAGGRSGATWMWVVLVRSKTQAWSVSKVFVLTTQDG